MAFRFDKFTIKAQEAVQAAVELAASRGNPQVGPVHLLQALVAEREGIVRPLLEKIGVETRVQSAIQMDEVCEPVIRRRAERHLQKGRVVIFAAGVGAPYFTTDSGAALRAAEMKCDALLKGTSVDGVYDDDPKKNPDAKRYVTVDYDTVLADNLKVMDASAVALCRDNAIPIIVFSIRERGNLARVLAGEGTQTIVQKEA